MSISDAEYTAWLASASATRVVLVEASVNVGGSETVRYLSNKGYVTSPSDTPSNTTYSALVVGGIKLTERLALDASATLSFGEIELDNSNGELDAWLDDVWTNRSVSVYFGDMRWGRSDFRLIFKGMFSGVGSQKRDRVNLFLRDSLQKLNSPLTDAKLGGSTTNKDRLLPLLFGECHNVSPLLVNPTTHLYQVHNGNIEDIIEVRDNGAPITVTKNLSAGTFSLSASPFGTITASVQGNKPTTYSNTIVENIKYIVKNYGEASNRLTDSDIDLTNFSAFATANTAPIGLYVTEKTNMLDACQQLAGSVGAQVVSSRLGLLQLLRIDFPPAGVPVEITASDMVEKSLSVVDISNVAASVTLGYNKNYTVEPNLQTVIPEEHKSLYAQEWLTVTQTDSTVASKYKLLMQPNQKDTLLQTTSDAQAEATRQLNIIKTKRTTYKFTGFSNLFQLSLGQAVTLKHSRFGLSAGATGVVVGLEPDWMRGRISVSVMV